MHELQGLLHLWILGKAGIRSGFKIIIIFYRAAFLAGKLFNFNFLFPKIRNTFAKIGILIFYFFGIMKISDFYSAFPKISGGYTYVFYGKNVCISPTNFGEGTVKITDFHDSKKIKN